MRLPGEAGDLVRAALEGAAARGVEVRLAYNLEKGGHPKPVPPPPRTEPDLIESLKLPTRGIPGDRDLMHHKYAVRDGGAVWTGSLNWTEDAWTLQENVVAEVDDADVAAAYRVNFDELWEKGKVEASGHGKPVPLDVGGHRRPVLVHARPRPPALAPDRRGDRRGHATGAHRVARDHRGADPRHARPGGCEGKLDLAGVIDGPQVAQVFDQWRTNGQSAWKIPLLATVLEKAPFAAKPSTPYAPGTPHDYMHAKVTVADDVVFVGSFNLSRSGEMNAENVLEIHSAEHAEAMAAFIDAVRARYPAARAPATPSGAGA